MMTMNHYASMNPPTAGTKTKRLLVLSTAFFACLLFVKNSQAAIKNATASGNWSSTSVWSGGVIPVAGDDVTMNLSVVLTIDGGTIPATGSLNSITVSQSGTVQFSTATGATSATVNIGAGG